MAQDKSVYVMPIKEERPKGPVPAEIGKRFDLLDAAHTTPEGRKLYLEFDEVRRKATATFLEETAEAREVWDQVCRAAHRREDKTVREAEKVFQAGINKIAHELAQDPRYSVWAESPEEKARREAEAATRSKGRKPVQTEPE